MPYFLVQASYSPGSMAALIDSPHDRTVFVRSVIAKLGGRIESFWLAFGDYDVVLLCQMPDAQTMAAFSMAVSAGGGITAIKTTPLLTWEEGILAMKQAADTGYRPPAAGPPPSM